MRKQATTLLWIAFYTFCLLPLAPLWAEPRPSNDPIPLQIDPQPLKDAPVAGLPLEIEAVIVGDKVTDATLYYRKKGESEYREVPMRDQGKGRYTAKIPKKDVVPPGVEYLIQASDANGTTTTVGQPRPPGLFNQSLTPLTVAIEQLLLPEERSLTDRLFPADEKQSARPASEGPAWYKRWWVWTIVGAVAAGAVVASKGKGGGDSPQPSSGTLTISGPVPKTP